MNSGWQTARLGDVLALLKNGLNCKQDKSGQGQRISRIESISLASFDLGRVGYAEISDQEKSKFRLLKGDILFSHINSPIHVGKTAVFDVDDEVYHGVNLLLMRPTPAVSAAYLELYLKYLFEQGYWLSVCKQSVNQASVNQQDISRVPIAYPVDLEEQRRIVAILDEAFEGIATAKANAEKNLDNARALFDSHLNSVFTQRGDGWPLRKLGELSDQITDGTHNSPPYVETGVPMLDSKHVQDDFSIDDAAPEKFISLATDALLSKRCKPRTGDILISSRGTIGKIAIVQEGQDFNIMGNMILIRLPNGVSRTFAAFYLRSQVVHIESIARGVAQKGLYLNQIRDYELPLPPEAEQAAIGKWLSTLVDETTRLAGIYEEKLAALDELKKSLLHQAFSGEL